MNTSKPPSQPSPPSKRKLTRAPTQYTRSEDSFGLLPENAKTSRSDDSDVSKYLRTSLHRGSMCGPPPAGFKDLLLDLDDEECPWQIASVKRQVDDIDLGDLDPDDPVYEIIRRRKISLHTQDEFLEPAPNPSNSVRYTKRRKEEYYVGSSKIIQQNDQGAISVRSDRKTKLYNRFKKFHLVQSLEELEEDNLQELLERNMFVDDDEDYESVSSGSVSIFGGSETEESAEGEISENCVIGEIVETLENCVETLENCVSVESLLSDIVDIANDPQLLTQHQNLSSPIVLSKSYDFEVHKTIVVTEVHHDDPGVKDLIEQRAKATEITVKDPQKLEGKTYSSQCTVWLRPDKQEVLSPSGDPKIYSAEVTCVYGEDTLVGEVVPGQEMSIFFSPHSTSPQLPLSAPRTPLQIDILPQPDQVRAPSPDKTVHITYANSVALLTLPIKTGNTPEPRGETQSPYPNEKSSLLTKPQTPFDSGIGTSLSAPGIIPTAITSLPKSASPHDSGICSPSVALHPTVKTPNDTAKDCASPEPIPDRDRIFTISGSSSEGIERDLQPPKEPMSMIPTSLDLDIIPEQKEQDGLPRSKDGLPRSPQLKTFAYSVNNKKRPKKKRRKKSKDDQSPGEIEHDTLQLGCTQTPSLVDDGDISPTFSASNFESTGTEVYNNPLFFSDVSPNDCRKRKLTKKKRRELEVHSSEEEETAISPVDLAELSKYIKTSRNNLISAIIDETLSDGMDTNATTVDSTYKIIPVNTDFHSVSQKSEENTCVIPEKILTPVLSEPEDIHTVVQPAVKHSESEYSIGEVCFPSPPDSGAENGYAAGDLAFGDITGPVNQHIPVYKAMLEIFDAAISEKEGHLEFLKSGAIFGDKTPNVDEILLQNTVFSDNISPESPPEFSDLPRLSFSDCYKVLPDNFQDRIDVLDESLSSDSDGPSTSSSWFTISSKSSAKSSFEVQDDIKDLKKMPSVDEEIEGSKLPREFEERADDLYSNQQKYADQVLSSSMIHVFYIDGESGGELVFGEFDDPFNEYLAEHLVTLDKINDSSLIRELMQAGLRVWSDEVSSDSSSCLPTIDCESFDDMEVALSQTKSDKPLFLTSKDSSIPAITIDNAADSLNTKNYMSKQPKKKRMKSRRKRGKSKSPTSLQIQINETVKVPCLDNQVPPNTPISKDLIKSHPILSSDMFAQSFEELEMHHSAIIPIDKSSKSDTIQQENEKTPPVVEVDEVAIDKYALKRSKSAPFSSSLDNDSEYFIHARHINSSSDNDIAYRNSLKYEEKRTSPHPLSDIFVVEKPSNILESLSETEEDERPISPPTFSHTRLLPTINIQLPESLQSLPPPLSPVTELCESPDSDRYTIDRTVESLLDIETATQSSNSDTEAPSKPPKPVLSKAQKQRLKKNKLRRTDGDKETSTRNRLPPSGLQHQGLDRTAQSDNILPATQDQEAMLNRDQSPTPSPENDLVRFYDENSVLVEGEIAADLVFGDIDGPYNEYTAEYIVQHEIMEEGTTGPVESPTLIVSSPDLMYSFCPTPDGVISDDRICEEEENDVAGPADLYQNVLSVYETVYETLISKATDTSDFAPGATVDIGTDSIIEEPYMCHESSQTITPDAAAKSTQSYIEQRDIATSLPLPTLVDSTAQSPPIETLHSSSQAAPRQTSSEIQCGTPAAHHADFTTQADTRPPSRSQSVQYNWEPTSAYSQADIRPHSACKESQYDIVSTTNVCSQVHLQPILFDSSQQADIRPLSRTSSSQSELLETCEQESQAEKWSISISSSTQCEAFSTVHTASQIKPISRDCCVTAAYIVEVETFPRPTCSVAVEANFEQQHEAKDEVDIWTPGLVCEDMVPCDSERVWSDNIDLSESPLKELADVSASVDRPESVNKGTQCEKESATEEFYDSYDKTSSITQIYQTNSLTNKDLWYQKAEAVLSSPVLHSPTSWIDEQGAIIRDLVKEAGDIEATCYHDTSATCYHDTPTYTTLQTLTERQDYLSALRLQVSHYMEQVAALERKLDTVSAALEKPNLWLASDLEGLHNQISVTRELQSELRAIGEDVTNVELFANQLNSVMPGDQINTYQSLRSNFNNIAARVGEKSNYLEVESNKFLKFRQDYNELGSWLQNALNDDSGSSEGNDGSHGNDTHANLQRAQNIYNIYKTRVDELGVLKLKLDNVITYGRDLLIHLSPPAAQQLTSDLSILHTLWIKLDEEVRGRYREVEIALEGLLNLQDHTNELTAWLDALTKSVDGHEANHTDQDDFSRHVALYEQFLMELETKGAMLQSTRQLSHQLMGALDTNYETFIASQFEICNARWSELSVKLQSKYSACQHLLDLSLSLEGHNTMLLQFESMLQSLEALLRRDGYDTSFVVGLPSLYSQVTAAANLIQELELDSRKASEAEKICTCGLNIVLGTLCAKCRAGCQLLLEQINTYQLDMDAHLSSVQTCLQQYTQLKTDVVGIGGAVGGITSTAGSIAAKVELVIGQAGCLLDLEVKKKAANDLALRLFKLSSAANTEAITGERADLERCWLKVAEDTARAKETLQDTQQQIKHYQTKAAELKLWLSEIRGKVGLFDPNHVGVPSSLKEDILDIKALEEELRLGELMIEEVRELGSQLKEDDSQDYNADLNQLLDTFRKIAAAVQNKTGLYEGLYNDWQAFSQGVEESKACVAELKELLQQEDPVGPELEDNFQEISKQRKLLYDACQGSVVALTHLSKKLVDKAGPDATAILLSELNAVQDNWEDTAEEATQQEVRLQASLSGWIEFNENLDKLTDWVEKAQLQVSNDIPKITGGKQLQKLNNKQEELERDMKTRDELYEELCDKGTFYINNCNFPVLEERMDNLDTQWKSVEEKIPNRSENIKCLLNVWQDIDEGTRELKEWLNDAKVAIPGDDLSVHSGSVDETAADLIRYKNFAEELRERRCNLHDLKAKLGNIECEEDSGELKKLFEIFEELDKNLEGVKDNTLSWRQTLEDSANLWNTVSPADDSMIAQELNKLSNQQCMLADAVTSLNNKIGDVLKKPPQQGTWCSSALRWIIALLLSYFILYTFMLWLWDNGRCPGRSWRWWQHLTPPLSVKSYHPQPH